MIKHLLIKVTPHVRRTILAGIVGYSGLSLSALAQDTNAPTKLKPTVVTGSLIPTAETVGATPVQTLSSTAIEEAGTSDTLTTLRKLVPGFSGAGNYLGSVNNNVNIGAGFQAFTGESYAQIRNLPTLVLLDGQRIVSSALSGGQSVDLNTIPLAMIDRIEVLKDGASAIYGSDAIGGVINVIPRKNFNGVEISGRYGFSTEDTRFTAGAQIYEQNALETRARSIGSLNAAQLAAHNIGAAPAYFSPS